jgi:hypothetical protein
MGKYIPRMQINSEPTPLVRGICKQLSSLQEFSARAARQTTENKGLSPRFRGWGLGGNTLAPARNGHTPDSFIVSSPLTPESGPGAAEARDRASGPPAAAVSPLPASGWAGAARPAAPSAESPPAGEASQRHRPSQKHRLRHGFGSASRIRCVSSAPCSPRAVSGRLSLSFRQRPTGAGSNRRRAEREKMRAGENRPQCDGAHVAGRLRRIQ